MRRHSAPLDPEVVDVDWGVWLRARGWIQSDDGVTWAHPDYIGWMPRTEAVREQMMHEGHWAILDPEPTADYAAT